MNQGALHFDALLSTNNFQSGINQIKKGIIDASKTAQRETRVMDDSFRNLGTAIAGYFTTQSLWQFTQELIRVRGEFQKTEIAFSTMLGSSAKASQLMGEMVDLAAKTPFGLEEVSSGAKQLLAFQVPAEQVVDVLTRMGNIAAGLGVPLSRINLVYGQVKAKGRLMGDDLRQFTEAGIPMVAELAKKFNTTESAISAMVSAGKIGFKDVEDVLYSLTNEGGMFFNLMEKQSASLSGQVANLGDTWDQMLNKIAQSNEGILYSGIQGLTYLVENYEDVIKVITTLIATYGTYRAALIVTNLLQTRMVAPAIIQGFANLIKMIRGATVAQEALNAASIANPYVLLATIIAALIAVTYNYRNELGELIGIIEEQTSAQKAQEAVMQQYNDNFGKGVSETKASISELIGVIRNENSSLDQRKAAYERLIKIDSTFRGALDAQYRATYRLGGAFEYVIGKIDAFAMAQAKAAASRKFLEASFEEQFKAGALKTQVLDADAEAKKWQKLDVEARKAGKANLEYARNAQKAEQKRVELAKQWREQQDIANDKTSISNTIIRNNNAEISQKEKQLSQIEREIKLNKLSGEQLTLKKREAEKLKYELSGFKPEVLQTEAPKVVAQGYVEQIQAQIDELEEAYKKAPNAAQAKRIRARISELQAKLDALKPIKNKENNKQLAEIFPEGSVKDLQRRVQLYNDAIDTALNGQVKLRKLDKYGNDKDKSGNPLLTGEVISLEEAYKRREELENQIRAKQYKNFQERVNEAERQWNNYYKMSEFYGKKTADAQYQELFKGSQNYLQYLEKEKEALQKKAEFGILTNEDKNNIIFLEEKINSLNGTETPLENFKRGIDDVLKSLPSLSDQLDALDKAEDDAFQKEGGNSNLFLEQKKYLEERRRETLQSQKDLYTDFLKEQRTFEEKKLEIEKKYNDIRVRLGKDNSFSQPQRLKLLDKSYVEETKEISSIMMESLQKTDLWIKAFGDLANVGPKTLIRLKKALKDYIATNKNLSAKDIKVLQDQIKKIDDMLSSSNPFLALTLAIEKYIQKRKELKNVELSAGKSSEKYLQLVDETNQEFTTIIDLAGNAAKSMLGFINAIGNAFGGLSEELKSVMNDIQDLVDGIFTAIKGYFSGNYVQMIAGIVQAIGALVRLLNGDKKREKQIQSWQRAVDELKYSYEQLNKEIEKTAGESSLAMQRQLIANLKEQQRILIQMRSKESEKKKSDQNKIASYTQQINDINTQIQEIADNFKESITTTEFKDLSQQIADALIDAFGQGENAAQAFEKVVDDVMKNAVANALRIKILEPAVQQMVDQLYSSMGFGNSNTSALENKIKEYENAIADLDNQINNASSIDKQFLQFQKQALQQDLNALKQQLADASIVGSFDGLTEQEREEIKVMGESAMQQYMDALKAYEDLFGSASENAQGLKGDIKGVTEKTAGALEAQINALRINIVTILKIHQVNQDIFRDQLLSLSLIESHTRNLIQMRKDLAELNAKTKNQLAGIP